RDNIDTILPGFTHLQHAQPVTLAHHLLAHLSRLGRDVERFSEAYERINVCPLGSAALAGTTYDIDRRFTAKLLGFSSLSVNAMDGVSDRDFASEFIFDCSLTMVHLSSICEELVIWSTPEFGFVEFDDAYSTGSSIMPQKKNPDIAELVRGRASGVIGSLVSILALGKGLPMAYNRDLQEDKSAVFAATDTTIACLQIMIPAVRTLRFDAQRMRARAGEGYMNATDLADYLVTKGVPSREAHEIAGRIVRHAIGAGKKIEDIPLPKLKEFSDRLEEDVYDVISLESCIGRRRSAGGTSPESVRRQIEALSEKVKVQRARVRKEERRLQSVWQKLL
ncbi:MAG: argininosuccinate lyase, partial [Euryarchaeota archaeon]|nr:argininosuccinate lyase [Euryarchaeota archaeon]